MEAIQTILHSDVDLWTVECSVSVIDLPWKFKIFQCIPKRGLCLVPQLSTSHEFLWTSRKFERERQLESTVHILHELQTILNLFCHLVTSAEYMSVILHESSHSSESGQSATEFVSMQRRKISKPHGKLSVTPLFVSKHETMSWAIHRLESHAFLSVFILLVHQKHVISVVCPMPRCFPQFLVEHLWRNYLLVATKPVFSTHHVNQSGKYTCTMRQKEGISRRSTVEHPEFLFGSHNSVISLCTLCHVLLPFLHLFGVWKRDGIDTLENLLLLVSLVIDA
mmetsp:Transcript_5666/g.21354  ORF Transcript_5666/g.21354 Transcript_5666/m.21354 type:complete len:280 (-) Transcript_5666:986-1825(-)